MNKVKFSCMIFLFISLLGVNKIFCQNSPLASLIDSLQDNDTRECIRKSYSVSNGVLYLHIVKCPTSPNHTDPWCAQVLSNPDNYIKLTIEPGGRVELGFTYTFAGSEGRLQLDFSLRGNTKVDVELSSDLPWNGKEIRALEPGTNTLKCVYKNYSTETANVYVHFSAWMNPVEGNSAEIRDAYVKPVN